MELLKEDKTLKASQRERGAGLGKRTEQKEEITQESRDKRQGEARPGRKTGFSAGSLGLCLSFLVLSQNIS